MSRILLFFLAIIFVLALGCDDPSDPDKLASRFVDAYYVEYDIDRALALAVGQAAERLTDEKRLVDDARRKVAVAASRSRTYYRKPERRSVRADLIHFTFPLEIHMGRSEIERSALVMLGHRENTWKVIAFREVADGSSRLGRAARDPETGEDRRDGVRSSTGAESGTLAP